MPRFKEGDKIITLEIPSDPEYSYLYGEIVEVQRTEDFCYYIKFEAKDNVVNEWFKDHEVIEASSVKIVTLRMTGSV